MNHLFLQSLIVMILSFLIAACVPINQELRQIPDEDAATKIIYRNGVSPGDGGEYYSRLMSSNLSVPLFSESPDPRQLNTKTISSIVPSISADGNYIAVFRESNTTTHATRDERGIGIFSVGKNGFVVDTKTTVPCATHLTASYSVPWSYFGHSFYVAVQDTIIKCSPEGKMLPLASIENLRGRRFPVSSHGTLDLFFAGKPDRYLRSGKPGSGERIRF